MILADSYLTIINTTVDNSSVVQTADNSGYIMQGGVFIHGSNSDVDLFNSTITSMIISEISPAYGGAIYFEKSNFLSLKGTLQVNNCTFVNCSSF